MAKGVITPAETQAEARRLYNAGLTAREIEELTGTPKDTVISWLTPAMKRRKEHRSAGLKAAAALIIELYNERDSFRDEAVRLALRAAATQVKAANAEGAYQIQLEGNVALHERYREAAAERDDARAEFAELQDAIYESDSDAERREAILDYVSLRYETVLRNAGIASSYQARTANVHNDRLCKIEDALGLRAGTEKSMLERIEALEGTAKIHAQTPASFGHRGPGPVGAEPTVRKVRMTQTEGVPHA
jgi:hypothetical protein